MSGRPPVRPIQYTALSEIRAPAKPESMTSGRSRRSWLAKYPPQKGPRPRRPEPEVVERRPDDYDEVAVGDEQVGDEGE